MCVRAQMSLGDGGPIPVEAIGAPPITAELLGRLFELFGNDIRNVRLLLDLLFPDGGGRRDDSKSSRSSRFR